MKELRKIIDYPEPETVSDITQMIILACKIGDLDIVRMILRKYPSVCYFSIYNQAIQVAIKNHHFEVLHILFEHIKESTIFREE